jgi:hypothetical protein
MSAFRKWFIVIAAMLPAILVWGMSVTSLTLWAIPWMKTFSASHGQIMATSMFMLLGMGCFSPLGGYIAERIAVRDLFIGGLGLATQALPFRRYCAILRAGS